MKQTYRITADKALRQKAQEIKKGTRFELTKIYELALMEGMLVLEKTYKTK